MKALILVDIQNDFCKNGALEVPQGNAIVSVANALIPKFELVVATQDWHPANHKSFAANHSFQKPGNVIDLNGLDQILWPIHCVQGSYGAEFVKDLNTQPIEAIFRKGTDPEIDSYSGFHDNGHRKNTGLAAYLRGKEVKAVYIVGLAADYCVKFTVLDALKEGFDSYLVEDGTRAVNLQPEDGKRAIKEMQAKGATIIQSASV